MTSPIKSQRGKHQRRRDENIHGRGINPVGATEGMEDALPSFIDPDFDDLEGLEDTLREQYGHRGSED